MRWFTRDQKESDVPVFATDNYHPSWVSLSVPAYCRYETRTLTAATSMILMMFVMMMIVMMMIVMWVVMNLISNLDLSHRGRQQTMTMLAMTEIIHDICYVECLRGLVYVPHAVNSVVNAMDLCSMLDQRLHRPQHSSANQCLQLCHADSCCAIHLAADGTHHGSCAMIHLCSPANLNISTLEHFHETSFHAYKLIARTKTVDFCCCFVCFKCCKFLF